MDLAGHAGHRRGRPDLERRRTRGRASPPTRSPPPASPCPPPPTPATAPLDRHPARIAVPVFLEGYAAREDDDALAFTVAGHAARRRHRPHSGRRAAHPRGRRGVRRLHRAAPLGRRGVARPAAGRARRPYGRGRRGPRRGVGRGRGRQGRGQGREGRHRRHGGAAGARRKAAAEMTGPESGADPHDNRRQVLYWRLLARLFDPEEQATLESASLAVVDGHRPAGRAARPAGLGRLDRAAPPRAGRRVRRPDGARAATPAAPATGRAEVRRAALASKVLLNVFATGSGTVTAGQLARWQSDAGWLERALGCGPASCAAAAVTAGLGAGPRRPSRPTWSSRMQLREVLADPALAGAAHPEHVADRAAAAGQGQPVRRGPGQRQGADPPLRRRGRRGAAHPGGEGHGRRPGPLGPAQAGVPQPRPRPHDLEEPHQLEPGGGAALRRPPLLPAHRPQDHARSG